MMVEILLFAGEEPRKGLRKVKNVRLYHLCSIAIIYVESSCSGVAVAVKGR